MYVLLISNLGCSFSSKFLFAATQTVILPIAACVLESVKVVPSIVVDSPVYVTLSDAFPLAGSIVVVGLLKKKRVRDEQT